MIFPPCEFSGHVKPGDRRFCRLMTPAKLVALNTCLTCPHAGQSSGPLEPRCAPPSTEAGPCVHRGEHLYNVKAKAGCASCGDAIVPVLSCAVHRVCTLETRAGTLPLCAGCKDRLSPESAALPELTGPANLVWFVYPRKETRDVWEAQQRIIAEAVGRFDGRKLCAVAVDDSTDQAAVDHRLWDEIVELPNEPRLRELAGWRWTMSRLRDQPGFTVRLHAKGVARGVQEQHMQAWWELSYAALLDVEAVRADLQRNGITGVFRINRRAPNLDVPWHYSGSFYAFRNDFVFSRPALEPACTVDPGWYVESWPALIAKREEAGCVRFDGVNDPYQRANWRGCA